MTDVNKNKFQGKNPNFKTGKEILHSIVEEIRQDLEGIELGRWQKPWTDILKLQDLPKNATTGEYYRGFNVFQLWGLAHKLGYPVNEWATFMQYKKSNIHLKKGALSGYIIKYGTMEKAPEDLRDGSLKERHQKAFENGETDKETVTLMYVKSYPVFNVSQTQGYEEKYLSAEILTKEEKDSKAFAMANEIEMFCGAEIHRGMNRAYFMPSKNIIAMPVIGQFGSVEEYIQVFFHELTHYFGSEHHLNRTYDSKKDQQRKGYAFEELVAELGSCLLCAHCGVSNVEIRQNHKRYIKSWIALLKDDPEAFQRASTLAFASFEYTLKVCEENKQKAIDNGTYVINSENNMQIA